MARAFQCDLCSFCEPGDPIVKLQIKGTDPERPQMSLSEEWCMECLAAFTEWRAARTPIDEEPDDHDEDESE